MAVIKSLLEKLALLFKSEYVIDVDMTIEITVDTDTFLNESTSLRSIVENTLNSLNCEVTSLGLDDLGEIAYDPVTGNRIRKNGKFSSIHAVKYIYAVSRETTLKKADVKAKNYDLVKFGQNTWNLLCTKLTEVQVPTLLHVHVSEYSAELKVKCSSGSVLSKKIFDSANEDEIVEE